ncbi:MAG: hypothetical protein MI867_02920 [Pseudomonadales bacterium]|nr:hypothetical protein [Pseudomonadales bacterium]
MKTLFNKKSLRKTGGARQKGQGMTEYLIVVALIAVAGIGVYRFFGDTIRSQIAGMAQEVSGQSAQDMIDNAQDRADLAANDGTTRKTMASYNANNL